MRLRKPSAAAARRAPLTVESLEDRELLAASLTAGLSGGVLRIEGTERADTITVRLIDGQYRVNNLPARFYDDAVNRIEVRSLGGNDRVTLGGPVLAPAVLRGGGGHDYLAGGLAADALFGEAGNDTLCGLGGDDFLDGGLGADRLHGGLGADKIHGDAGNDFLAGGDGRDVLVGGDGADQLTDTGTAGHLHQGRGWFDPFADAAVRSLSRYLYLSDGGLSRGDALGLFAQVYQDNVVTVAELGDLRTLSSNGFVVGMAAPVNNLFGKVVNPHRANAWFTGATAPTPLGNLEAGATGVRLRLLVAKWFLGQDRPTALAGSGTQLYAYRFAAGSLFGPGGSLDYTHVRQGDVSTCYLLATLAGLAEQNPQAIRDMFTDNGDGTWAVRFFNGGAADYVTVDATLPVTGDNRFAYNLTGRSIDDTSNVLWAALLEKAYAQLNESGWVEDQDGTNSYQGVKKEDVQEFHGIGWGFSGKAAMHVRGGSWIDFGTADAGAPGRVDAALNAGQVVTILSDGHYYTVVGRTAPGWVGGRWVGQNTYQVYNTYGSLLSVTTGFWPVRVTTTWLTWGEVASKLGGEVHHTV